jgi:3-phosphoshikimate 1-carboxyvinyltransferase
MSSNISKPLISSKTNNSLNGEIIVPGDKSISHRSLIFSSLANGLSTISGLLEGEDVIRTANALESMGVEIKKNYGGIWEVNGVGLCGLSEPDDVLDMGNSGTSSRLLMGLVSSFNFKSFFTGDDSLRKRPMKRIFDPILQNGSCVYSRSNNTLPALIVGSQNPLPITYTMNVASAQVKSAILLSSLNIPGTTTIIEPEKCRDHSEIMMKSLGLDIKSEDIEVDGNIGTKITFNGNQEFNASDFKVPGDVSSAAFLIVAALITEGSDLKINNVGMNPSRSGIIETLIEMGGNIELLNERLENGEMVADISVKYSKLSAINVPASRAPSMIDEYPILAVAAANAVGTTRMNGLGELKVKESDRLSAINEGLVKSGVKTNMGDDFLEVHGGISQPKFLIEIETHMDHRIAMSFLIMGLKLDKGLKINDSLIINTSFPSFVELFSNFGIDFKDE